MTYEDSASYDKEDDEIYQKSKEAQIVHFGQIPPLLFEKPHVKRESRKVGACHLDYVQKIKLMISMKEKPIGIHINSNDLYIVKRNVIEILSLQSNPASLQKTKKFSLEKSQSIFTFIQHKTTS